jgi:hypothetical protein
MKKLIFGLIILGLTIQTYGQIKTEELSEVVISATNYKYLNKVGLENASIPVALLEQKVASFNVKDADFYTDEYDTYEVSFYIPDGYILASYDGQGNILRTAERFKDVALPRPVIESVARTYPGWTFAKDTYLVNYYDQDLAGKITKRYKIILKKDNERIRVKCDEEGNFL